MSFDLITPSHALARQKDAILREKLLQAQVNISPHHSQHQLFPTELKQIIAELHGLFEDERQTLLEARKEKQVHFDANEVPTYCKDHPARKTGWQVAEIPADLLDRRVEITGPVSNTKMVINMLNAGEDGERANTAMLDFEDSMKPTWENVVRGLDNVIGVAEGNLRYEQPGQDGEPSKVYRLVRHNMAHPMVRVRGLHMVESNVQVDGVAVSAGLFDLTCTAYHTAKRFLQFGKTPKFYVPKCEHYLEARWWNSLFSSIESHLHLPEGTLKVTFLIETLPAAYQMEEILFEIRERACGLNGGRWDKIFSDIKTLKTHKDRVLANRSSIDMSRPWMENYAKLLIKICHKRGAFAMGGMSAFTPGQDEQTRKLQAEKVTADKKREATIGHDGCWVSHPYFIGLAKSQFERRNQLDVMLADFPCEPELLPDSSGPKTLEGLRQNLRVGIAYQRAWDQGAGCVAFENLMEDLATLEISRAQVWQWLFHKVVLDDGTEVTRELVQKLFDEECRKILTDQNVSDPEEIESYWQAKNKIENVFLKSELDNFFNQES
jgi:malate synthase